MKTAEKNRDEEKRPKYRPMRWKHVIASGCYWYALDMFNNNFSLIGDSIGKRCNEKVSNEILISTLLEELKLFGYDAIMTKRNEVNEKVIILQREVNTGYYHFFRQDDDGLWSHKYTNAIPERAKNPIQYCESNVESWCFILRKIAS